MGSKRALPLLLHTHAHAHTHTRTHTHTCVGVIAKASSSPGSSEIATWPGREVSL